MTSECCTVSACGFRGCRRGSRTSTSRCFHRSAVDVEKRTLGVHAHTGRTCALQQRRARRRGVAPPRLRWRRKRWFLACARCTLAPRVASSDVRRLFDGQLVADGGAEGRRTTTRKGQVGCEKGVHLDFAARSVSSSVSGLSSSQSACISSSLGMMLAICPTARLHAHEVELELRPRLAGLGSTSRA